MQMKYTWTEYCGAYEAGVEALFDSEAMKFTGCDDGFLAFYDYWRRELKEGEFFAKVILDGGELIGVVALARAEDGVFNFSWQINHSFSTLDCVDSNKFVICINRDSCVYVNMYTSFTSKLLKILFVKQTHI